MKASKQAYNVLGANVSLTTIETFYYDCERLSLDALRFLGVESNKQKQTIFTKNVLKGFFTSNEILLNVYSH